jgi:hypothetical protein
MGKLGSKNVTPADRLANILSSEEPEGVAEEGVVYSEELPVEAEDMIGEELPIMKSSPVIDNILSEIAELQKEEIISAEELQNEYQLSIAEENIPPVILEGIPMQVIDGKYVPYEQAQLFFQKKRVLNEFRKYNQLLSKLKK